MRRLNDEKAVSPIIGFIIATVIFSASFYYVMQSAIQHDPEGDQALEYTAVANSLADVIMAPGRNWYLPGSCVGGVLPSSSLTPEEVGEGSGTPAVYNGRFGLGDENCGRSLTDPGARNRLSYDKFVNLYQAQYEADATNGRVDYREARRSLGLDGQNVDFHIRSWPVLANVREILASGYKDQQLRPLYIGDYQEGATAPPRPTITTSGLVTDGADAVTVSLTISNDVASVESNFQASFTVRLDKGAISVTRNTFAIAPGASDTVSVDLRKTRDWTWDGAHEVEFDVSDMIGQVDAGSLSFGAIDMANPSNNANNVVALANMDRRGYAEPFSGSNKWPRVLYDGYNGRGQKQATFDEDNVELKVFECSGAPASLAACTLGAYSKVYADPNRGGQSLEDGSEPGVGLYRVELWEPDVSGTLRSVDYFEVTSATSACNVNPGDYVPAASAITESGYVDHLFEQFQLNAYAAKYSYAPIVYASGGDVLPDIKCAMNNDLPNVLLDANGVATTAVYTTLVVGSNVDHNAMTSSAAKETIRDWVFGGGTLIVFGSDEQSVTWLQPIFHSALTTGNGGVYTPDADHPVLNVPTQLDPESYLHTTVWQFNAGAGDEFDHVAFEAANQDILSVGNPGAFGEGQVILTSWRPYSLTADQATSCQEPLGPNSQCHGLFLIHNLVTLSYRNLYLDYGPSIPIGEPSGAQIRIGSLHHPELEEIIGIQIQVFAFPGGG